MNRYAVTVEYDGSAFSGWQFQENAHTAQAELEKAIRHRFREKRRVGGASRTDAGVHALGQVAVFDLAHSIPATHLASALNSALPPTIRVRKVRAVSAGWDPRQAAREKTYSYLVHDHPIYSPLLIGRAWQVNWKLDQASMKKAARYLIGRHDFTSFRGSGCEAAHARRHLKRIEITRSRGILRLRFTADAFLYHMARNLAGTLVEVGRGKIKPAQMKKILAARDRSQAGPTAPACGLYLEVIRF